MVSLTEVPALFKKEKGRYKVVSLRAHWQADTRGKTSFQNFI